MINQLHGGRAFQRQGILLKKNLFTLLLLLVWIILFLFYFYFILFDEDLVIPSLNVI